MSRRAFDFYPTPAWATRILLQHVNVHGWVYEPCVGAGDISRAVTDSALVTQIRTNDIDTARDADEHRDARRADGWTWVPFDWVISNPPFTDAFTITKLAVEHARIGVAMLLRLSFLEPTQKRGQWLADHPPNKLIVCPRISFTGDGKTDSVTTAWLVWDKRSTCQRLIVVPKSQRGSLLAPEATQADLLGGDAA